VRQDRSAAVLVALKPWLSDRLELICQKSDLAKATRVRQIVSNLVSNAVKFTDAGCIKVTARRLSRSLVLAVADTGPGLPAEVRERLFSAFMQADTSTTRKFGGTGLGLAICRQLADLMGGAIEIDDDYHRGAKFIVRLPLVRVGEAARTRKTAQVAAQAPPKELRILAAEDNPVNRKVLQTILEQVGLGVTFAENGLEALEAFRAQAWDVVLMDIQMPVMDGAAAAAEIRRQEALGKLPRTPIVGLTANAMEHQKSEYLSAGMDAVVAKPIQIGELLQVIDHMARRPAKSLAG